ncbi:uncharacterized protein LOC112594159 [Melanaphis sacchari]|uniref:uncharacterized protein LOC112594159 n=1 Tax=Melanaphis sacchari TaxID=742174 RepID=UPI000DC1315B|nr:uncharacterized protein LOC112594159 [Melanaphis sacchari]
MPANMKGYWIFVLLCLSFVGELVLGSLFPPIPPNNQNPSQPDVVPPQQEVNWPLNNLATPEVIVVGETTLNTRGIQMEQTKDRPSETSLKAEEILPKAIVIENEQKSVDKIVTRSNAEMKTKDIRPTTDNKTLDS